jgi:3-hydroxyisobutyrate dehydrogenase
MKVSVLGAGLMGAPMAERLLDGGHQLTVWNRTAAKLAPLTARGAAPAASPREALAASEASLLMLRDGPVTERLLLEGDGLPDLAGRTLIQMGTISPAESQALAEAVAEAGGDYLEAPVLGSTPQAREGKLLIFAGGDPDLFERWLPLLAELGIGPRRVGRIGSAAAVKIALNQVIASHVTALSLALGLVRGGGVSPEIFMDILRKSSLYAAAFDGKLPRLLARDFAAPNFPTEMLLKDVDLALGEARDLELDGSALAGIRQVLSRAVDGGWGRDDYSAVYAVIDPERS